MKVGFRELREGDIEQTLKLFQDLRDENAGVSFVEYGESDIREWLKDENVFVYAAECEGKIAGVFKAKRGEDDKRHCAFLTAATDKDFRGKNIARDLTLYGIEKIKEKGIKIARAYIYSDNKASINTILSCGFQFAGSVHMHHYDDKADRYVDDLIFHKIIG